MNVRNCAELGENAQKIMKRLLTNQNLLKLLYYTDKDPLSHEDLTQEQIQNEVFHKLIRIIPRVGPKEDARSIVVFKYNNSKLNDNNEFNDISFDVESFVPMTQWLIKGEQLRPFAIMGEIENSLKGKRINGLGTIKGGEFALNFLTEEISSYEQTFHIVTFD